MSDNATPLIGLESMAVPSSRLDKVGIAMSLACAVHCLAGPFLILLLPTVESIWSHPSVHWILAALVLPIALLVVYRGYRVHRRRTAIVSAVVGVGFIIAGLLVPYATAEEKPAPTVLVAGPDASASEPGTEACTDTCCPSIVEDPDTGEVTLSFPLASVTTLVGSVFLVLAHVINLHGCYCFRKGRNGDSGDCGCAAIRETGSARG